mmetsp:Transcript_50419/g.141725  ORF Transcript_50419/g.141725 Transcript_50419/m.141725 type:complete len:330 (+) Transcript_50419:609-1598(+)
MPEAEVEAGLAAIEVALRRHHADGELWAQGSGHLQHDGELLEGELVPGGVPIVVALDVPIDACEARPPLPVGDGLCVERLEAGGEARAVARLRGAARREVVVPVPSADADHVRDAAVLRGQRPVHLQDLAGVEPDDDAVVAEVEEAPIDRVHPRPHGREDLLCGGTARVPGKHRAGQRWPPRLERNGDCRDELRRADEPLLGGARHPCVRRRCPRRVGAQEAAVLRRRPRRGCGLELRDGPSIVDQEDDADTGGAQRCNRAQDAAGAAAAGLRTGLALASGSLVASDRRPRRRGAPRLAARGACRASPREFRGPRHPVREESGHAEMRP